MAKSFLKFVLVGAGCLMLGACASEQSTTEVPALSVPWSGPMLASRTTRVNREQLLADGDIVVPRGENTVDGPTPIYGVSAFSTYTYDNERISLPGGSGYRYRTEVQSGISIP